MAWILKNPGIPQRVSEIVSKNTGMPKELLLSDPLEYKINGIEDAAALFLQHVKNNDIVRVHTDYDTDGWGCSVIQNILLNEVVSVAYPDFAEQWDVYVPCRYADGFGIRTRHVEKYYNEGAKLLITCDNGIAAVEAVARARELGMDVIILDHHDEAIIDGVPTLPNANIVIDPHVTGGTYEDYCGAGISLYFAKEVMKQMGLPNDFRKEMTKRLTAIAAISTVGDVVSLTWDNRNIVRSGLSYLTENPPTRGLKELLERKGMVKVTSTDVAFGISPIINALGRLKPNGTALMVDELGFVGRINDKHREYIQMFIDKNKERQEITAEAVERAELQLAQTNQLDNAFLLIVDPQLSTGIAGLVSGRLTEKYKRPSIVLAGTSDPDVFKGSGRSPKWCSMIDLLNKNASYMVAYGGHPGACGLTVLKENIDGFREAMVSATPSMPEEALSDDVGYDIECEASDIPAVFTAVDMFGPYGQDNPEIQVRVDGVELVANSRGNFFLPMGAKGQHIKLYAKNGFDIVWFDGFDKYKKMGEPKLVDLIGTLSLNIYKNTAKIQVQVTDLRVAE